MQTIDTPTFGPGHPFTVERLRLIREILANGQAARFTYHAGTTRELSKDVKSDAQEYTDDGRGDMQAFRQTGGRTHYVCWDSPDLVLSATPLTSD